jgi:hypothetical protein
MYRFTPLRLHVFFIFFRIYSTNCTEYPEQHFIDYRYYHIFQVSAAFWQLIIAFLGAGKYFGVDAKPYLLQAQKRCPFQT